MIQKIYETDPLVCPKCQGTMRIISSIEDGKIIKAILKHLGLWHIKSKPPPKAHGPPSVEYFMDDLKFPSMTIFAIETPTIRGTHIYKHNAS